ncbi:MAG: VWA domain-containing protein [Campylobacteraceae bacterium]|nr:VWA domain-containing protein [Campylobacteraceae bacterium]
MEEVIGKVWDKFIIKKVNKSYEKQKVLLKDKKKSLKIFYHLLGGDKSKEILITDKRNMLKKRNLLEKISGMGKSYFLPWQDEKALYLPSFISTFANKEDNEMLYFWIIALMSKSNITHNNFILENIKNTNALINRYEGFKKFYDKCSNKLFEEDDELSYIKSLNEKDLLNEEINQSPYALWVYPALNTKTKFEEFEEEDEGKKKKKKKDENAKTDTLEMKKQVNQLDDKKKTDGLLIFLPDALMSILEQVNVDRSEDDSFDEDAIYNATDLDEITLGRKKANLNARIKMDLDIETRVSEEVFLGKGFYLDEWDYKKNDYAKNYVCIKTIINDNIKAIPLAQRLKKIVKRVQNELDLMQIDKIKKDNLIYGDELNLDSWLEYKTSLNKNEHKQNFFINYEKKNRSMSTLILADISLSTEAGITSEIRVIDMIKDSLMVFSEALTRLEDKFSIYAFSSLKNTKVRFHIIKNFKEKYSNIIRGRINEIKPGYYTRLGAAIRQSTKILEKQDSNNKLLLIISDGKPNDVDKYDGRYGIEDTKKAILEAKLKGITPFCVTIDLEAKDYLSHLFGKNGYVLIKNSKNLPKALSDIYINLTK